MEEGLQNDQLGLELDMAVQLKNKRDTFKVIR